MTSFAYADNSTLRHTLSFLLLLCTQAIPALMARRPTRTKTDIMKRLILPFIMSLAFAHGAAAYDNVFDSDIFDNQIPNEEELEDDWSSQDTVGDMGQTTQTATTLLCAAAYLLYALYKKD